MSHHENTQRISISRPQVGRESHNQYARSGSLNQPSMDTINATKHHTRVQGPTSTNAPPYSTRHLYRTGSGSPPLPLLASGKFSGVFSPVFDNSSPLYGQEAKFHLEQASPSFPPAHSALQPTSVSAASLSLPNTHSTLWWGDLEPWMDEEYVRQVGEMMGWENNVQIKIPHPSPDPVTGQQANNPGYCFLTFPSPAYAAAVLSQVNGSASVMPNSQKPFMLNWASSAPALLSSALTSKDRAAGGQQYPKEYSIFVGDLAPETSNSDLVAVFRNPVLGLRNDREPKFIRPFTSCKSAKIMLDPVTGVSRGYGFVRFTDEMDQQRALIEMHGLYCLSRPMRISAATAKFKPALQADNSDNQEHITQPVSVAIPLPGSKSVSAAMATSPQPVQAFTNQLLSVSADSRSSMSTNASVPSLSSTSSIASAASHMSASPDNMMNIPSSVLAQLAQQFGQPNEKGVPEQTPAVTNDSNSRYVVSEESWKHQAQARAILGNLMGPNGEQLTSTDPYNTTVFVGGLSPLISEETLRTFFIPFGEIHYVKVPVGKHCGFVQFVRKADAERAIERMQGFSIGGSRIRLSWGRSQYKAAQAAAQAAQKTVTQLAAAPLSTQISSDQVLELFQKLGFIGSPERLNEILPGFRKLNSPSENLFPDNASDDSSHGFQRNPSPPNVPLAQPMSAFPPSASFPARPSHSMMPVGMLETRQDRSQVMSSFSPFSPDPNPMYHENRREEPLGGIPRSTSMFIPGQIPHTQVRYDLLSGSISNTSMKPPGVQRFHSFYEDTKKYEPSHINGGPENVISRPTSSDHAELEGKLDRASFISRETDTQSWRKSNESPHLLPRNQDALSNATSPV